MAHFIFSVFFKTLMLIFCLYKSRKKSFNLFLQNFIFFHPYESINFSSEGLLKLALILTALLKDFCTWDIQTHIFIQARNHQLLRMSNEEPRLQFR